MCEERESSLEILGATWSSLSICDVMVALTLCQVCLCRNRHYTVNFELAKVSYGVAAGCLPAMLFLLLLSEILHSSLFSLVVIIIENGCGGCCHSENIFRFTL